MPNVMLSYYTTAGGLEAVGENTRQNTVGAVKVDGEDLKLGVVSLYERSWGFEMISNIPWSPLVPFAEFGGNPSVLN